MRPAGTTRTARTAGTTGKRPPRSLKARAIGYLARRDYARAELRHKLLGMRGEEAPDAVAVDALLDELAALGYLSDARFAQAVVTRKTGSYSQRAIAQVLKAKGVAADTVAEALTTAQGDDASALIAIWQRRFGEPPRDEREKARQVRFLQSRGFSLSAIFKLLRSPPDRND